MDEVAYQQFKDLEKGHWWFQGRRAIFFSLLDRFLSPGGRSGVPEPRLLDIGCGMGGMLPDLSRYGTAVGLDLSEESLQFCQKRGYPEVALGDGYRLPFSDRCFDLVSLFDTVEHIDEDAWVFREASRVVKAGGLVMVTVPAYQFLYSDNVVVALHKRRYRAGVLRKKLREAGLRPVKTSYYNAILLPVIVPLVLLKKLKMRLFGVPEKPRSNISYAIPGFLNALLSAVFRSERFLIPRVSSPAGHSLLCLAKKD